MQSQPIARHSSTPPPPKEQIEIAPSILYFGTPVALVTTVDEVGQPNITPMSSVWALGDRLVLGLSQSSAGARNLQRAGECVVNMACAGQWASVEAISRTTGRADVPEYKREIGYDYEPDKFSLGGFTALPAVDVRAPRIAECPLQFEARVVSRHAAVHVEGNEEPGFVIFETLVLRTHAHREIVRPGTQRIDTSAWKPLLYVFRHYFGTGPRLAQNFRAEA